MTGNRPDARRRGRSLALSAMPPLTRRFGATRPAFALACS